MHQSALKYGKLFFETYLYRLPPEQLIIVDVGSQDVNGSLRQFAPAGARYFGVDFVEGTGVDVILTDPYKLPFDTGTVDAVVCSSVFEHSEFFWLLFLECIRIVKQEGVIYINTPSNGMVHRYPVDSWRFYPDAGHSLAKWANRHGECALLLESFIAPKIGPMDGEGMWNDFVAVFLKDESYSTLYTHRILDKEPSGFCVHRSDQKSNKVQLATSPDQFCMVTQEAEIAAISHEAKALAERYQDAIAQRDGKIGGLEKLITERDTLIAGLEKAQSERDNSLQYQARRIEAILKSNSWRATAPVRSVAEVFRRVVIPAKRGIVFLFRLPLLREISIFTISRSRFFDEPYYLRVNPDVKQADVDAATHYFLIGWKEHRDPSAIFCTQAYLEKNPDLVSVGINPLLHYIKFERAEGRLAGAPANTVLEHTIQKSRPKKPLCELDRTNNENNHSLKSAKYPQTLRIWGALRKAIAYYRGSIIRTLVRVTKILAREGLSGLNRRIDILAGAPPAKGRASTPYEIPRTCAPDFCPKISVIVPNFNHAKHLQARLDSIYAQTYSNYEVVLLDDCSTDDSVSILQDYARQHSSITKTCFNSENSGGVFKQWRKGLELAHGELIWIAESDDICSANFLETLVRFFANPAVMLAIARTEFVQGTPPKTIWTQEEYLSDLGHDIWLEPFVKSATELVRLGWAAKNIAPNVSGVLFRSPIGLKVLEDPAWLGLRMCGDWVFYLNVIRGGLVGYSPDATNYYRQHNENTSVKTQSTVAYLQEHEIVGKCLAKLYPLGTAEYSLQERILYNHWCMSRGDTHRSEFELHYSLDRIRPRDKDSVRKPNIAIAVYALSAGGGETFPLNLANNLWRRGHAITVINFNGQTTERGVREMLLPSIPLIDLPRCELIRPVLEDLGIELVHSHHAWVDVNLATFLSASESIRHVVTTHGMYEMMEQSHFDGLLPRLESRIDAFVYTAEKNLAKFPAEFQKTRRFVRIDNALPVYPTNPLSRAELGIAEEDFVLCMVARAIPEKGWEEGIASVVLANKYSKNRKIHLLLIGAGPESDRLERLVQANFIHFLGFRSNIRDYFAIADAGFLPTRFKGESAPLVLIDCLVSGKPMIASALGEIPFMLASKMGVAGIIFELDDWHINVKQLARLIFDLANEPNQYLDLRSRVADARSKFDIDLMVDKYESLYTEVINNGRGEILQGSA